MSRFKVHIELEQYTPLLHFQGGEPGACLRASEVKPKLDRFVMEWLWSKGIRALPESWIGHKADGTDRETVIRRTALRYKMKFEGQIEGITADRQVPGKDGKKRVQKQIHALYFGAMGDQNFDAAGESKVKAVKYSGIQMDILCMVRDTLQIGSEQLSLLQLLRRLIEPFFALHCFGTRSSKGFGSFGVKSVDGERVKRLSPGELAGYVPGGTVFYADYREQRPQPREYLDDVQTLAALIGRSFKYKKICYRSRRTKRLNHPIHFKPYDIWLLMIPRPIPEDAGTVKQALNRFCKKYPALSTSSDSSRGGSGKKKPAIIPDSLNRHKKIFCVSAERRRT